MASANFRDSLGTLGWSRRDEPVNTSSATPILGRLQSLNPFGQGGYVRLPTTETNPGAPLPAPTRREEEEGWFALSRWDRLLLFGGLVLAALVMFVVAFGLMFTPVFILKPRKFVVLWTMGSVLFLASFAVMMGPIAYVQHLLSGPRLPFTAAYFGSIALTLYFSVGGNLKPTPHPPATTPKPCNHGLILRCMRDSLTSPPKRSQANVVPRPRDVTFVQLHSTFLTLIAAIVQTVALIWYLVSYFPMGSTGLRFAAQVGGNRVAAWMRS
ncbi:uncharacterized protein PV09_02316 [Verruconis gallopava]|uniref:Protein transport protein SFT2 n=1 Tax=Verruconis gallopava TaxID=253628 RepID=A0A0D1XV02_9PEZI|nr:uncharacterized protein PV09_02316 [Verruconis gallopava]KIW06601.1 hypothetical protein PV09_02316 [Verruconis gallopava]